MPATRPRARSKFFFIRFVFSLYQGYCLFLVAVRPQSCDFDGANIRPFTYACGKTLFIKGQKFAKCSFVPICGDDDTQSLPISSKKQSQNNGKWSKKVFFTLLYSLFSFVFSQKSYKTITFAIYLPQNQLLLHFDHTLHFRLYTLNFHICLAVSTPYYIQESAFSSQALPQRCVPATCPSRVT